MLSKMSHLFFPILVNVIELRLNLSLNITLAE